MSGRWSALIAILLTTQCEGHKLRNDLAGKHLIVTSINLPPLMEISANGNGQLSYAGPLYSQLKWLSKRLNFSYTMIREPKNAIGVKVNGSWDGIVGQIARNEADLAAFPFGLSLTRGEVVEHCGLFSADQSSLLTKYPSGYLSWTAAVQPFSIQGWMGWLAVVILVPFTCAIFVYIRSAHSISGHSSMSTIGDMLMYLFGTITAQGGYYQYGHRYLGIVAITWCLGAFVLVNVYSCTLTSFLAASYKSPDINSVQELADSNDYRLITLKGLVTEDEILTAKSGSYKKLGDQLRKCSECRALSVEDIGKRVLGGRYIGFMPSGSVNNLIRVDYYKNHRKCSMTTAFGKAEWKFIYLGVPKSSPFKEEINRESLWAHAFGLPVKWKSFPTDFRPCKLNYNKRGVQVTSSQNRLNLQQFFIAFIVLLTGCFIAGVAFIVEFSLMPRRNRQ